MNEKKAVEMEWTGPQLLENFPNAKNLKDLLAQIGLRLTGEGSVLCRVEVNGVEVTEHDEEALGRAGISEINRLSVRTQKLGSLIEDSLKFCLEYAEKLTRAMESCIESLRLNEFWPAQNILEDCMKGTRIFLETTGYLAIVLDNEKQKSGVVGTSEPPLRISWTRWQNELIAHLRKALDGFAKKDFILTADLIEYGVLDLLQIWRSELALLDEQIRRGVEGQLFKLDQ